MKKYLVIGNPIEHSLSPKLHNFWFKANNINSIYEKKKLNKDELSELILDIKKKKIDGVNVTVPFKNSVIPYLDKLSSEAKITQSVNTIYLEDKKVMGHNTDIEGFENSIRKTNFKTSGKKIFILGGGGVVSSIIVALSKLNVSEITLCNRTRIKAENLKKSFKNIKIIDWGDVPYFDIIINATSIGLKKDEAIEIDLSKVGNNKLFYDVIYNPKQTNFLELGKKLGNQTENGKMMFLYQAQKAFQKWHQILPEINKEVINLLDD